MKKLELDQYETFVTGKDVTMLTLADGLTRKVLAYNEQVMMCEISMKKEVVVAEHQHIHVQTSYIVSGKCAYTVGDKTKELVAGDSVIISQNEPHCVVAVEDSVILDVFSPMRKDFVQKAV